MAIQIILKFLRASHFHPNLSWAFPHRTTDVSNSLTALQPINRYANLPPYWPQNNHLPPHFWLHKLPLSTFSFENSGVPVRALHQQTKSCTPHPFPCAHISSSTAIASLIRQIERNQGSRVLGIAYLVCLPFIISMKLREDEVCQGILGCTHK